MSSKIRRVISTKLEVFGSSVFQQDFWTCRADKKISNQIFLVSQRAIQTRLTNHCRNIKHAIQAPSNSVVRVIVVCIMLVMLFVVLSQRPESSKRNIEKKYSHERSDQKREIGQSLSPEMRESRWADTLWNKRYQSANNDLDIGKTDKTTLRSTGEIIFRIEATFLSKLKLHQATHSFDRWTVRLGQVIPDLILRKTGRTQGTVNGNIIPAPQYSEGWATLVHVMI